MHINSSADHIKYVNYLAEAGGRVRRHAQVRPPIIKHATPYVCLLNKCLTFYSYQTADGKLTLIVALLNLIKYLGFFEETSLLKVQLSRQINEGRVWQQMFPSQFLTIFIVSIFQVIYLASNIRIVFYLEKNSRMPCRGTMPAKFREWEKSNIIVVKLRLCCRLSRISWGDLLGDWLK